MKRNKVVSKIKDISDYSSDEDKKMQRKRKGGNKVKKLSSFDGSRDGRDSPKGSPKNLSPYKIPKGELVVDDLENQYSNPGKIEKLKRKATGRR